MTRGRASVRLLTPALGFGGRPSGSGAQQLRARVAEGVEPGGHRAGHGARPLARLQAIAGKRAGAAAVRDALHRLNRASGALLADLSRRASDAAADPGTRRRRARSLVDDPNAVCAGGGGPPDAGAVLVETALPVARTAGLRRRARTRRGHRSTSTARTTASGATGSAASGAARAPAPGIARRATSAHQIPVTPPAPPRPPAPVTPGGAVLCADTRTVASDNHQREARSNGTNATQTKRHFCTRGARLARRTEVAAVVALMLKSPNRGESVEPIKVPPAK